MDKPIPLEDKIFMIVFFISLFILSFDALKHSVDRENKTKECEAHIQYVTENCTVCAKVDEGFLFRPSTCLSWKESTCTKIVYDKGYEYCKQYNQ